METFKNVAEGLIMVYLLWKGPDIIHAIVSYLKSKAETQWAKDALDFVEFSLNRKIGALQVTARKELDKSFADGKITASDFEAGKKALMDQAVAEVINSKSDAISFIAKKYNLTEEELTKFLKDIGQCNFPAIKADIVNAVKKN